MKRISSIDVVRGLVMVIMALDHVRDWTHGPSIAWGDPTDLATTTPFLFFTRWITHFCAPTFVFLAGTSIFLSMRKRGATKESKLFLLKRGIWLVLLEIVVVGLGWHLDLRFPFVALQVIWAIGISMIVMSVASSWSVRTNFIVGGAIILFHNAFDWYQPVGDSPVVWVWRALHVQTFTAFPWGQKFYLVYPLLPWIGTMMLGFAFGSLFVPKPGQQDVDVKQLRNTLVKLGLGVTALFVAFRAVNLYGDLHTWTLQKDWVFNVLAFLNTTKYPPSFQYLCMTLGPTIVLIGLLTPLTIDKLTIDKLTIDKLTIGNWRIENWRIGILKFSHSHILIFGRVPMFYYLAHLYIGHILCWALIYFIQGYPLNSFYDARTFGGNPWGSGFDLWVTYVVWIGLVVLLYPMCKWYDNIKSANPQSKLFRYL